MRALGEAAEIGAYSVGKAHDAIREIERESKIVIDNLKGVLKMASTVVEQSELLLSKVKFARRMLHIQHEHLEVAKRSYGADSFPAFHRSPRRRRLQRDDADSWAEDDSSGDITELNMDETLEMDGFMAMPAELGMSIESDEDDVHHSGGEDGNAG
jgi:hypothetical protein